MESWIVKYATLGRKRLQGQNEIERLFAEADEEDRIGDGLKGCSWMGDEHPSMSHYRRATDLRRLAHMLGEPERKVAREKARKVEKEQEFQDSMVEDRDY